MDERRPDLLLRPPACMVHNKQATAIQPVAVSADQNESSESSPPPSKGEIPLEEVAPMLPARSAGLAV